MERRSALRNVHSKGLLRGGIGAVRRLLMQLDLDDVETRALLNLLVEAIEADRYPFRRASGTT